MPSRVQPTVVTPITILPEPVSNCAHVNEVNGAQDKAIGAQVKEAVQLPDSSPVHLKAYLNGNYGDDSKKQSSENDVKDAIPKGVTRASMSSTYGIEMGGKEVKWIIDPKSKFMQKWDILTALALVFTSVVTPFEVGFLETKINTLFVINRLVDVLFLSDMVMHFFLAFEHRDFYGKRFVKSHKRIARHYLSSWFCLDLASCLPFDFVGILMDSESVQRMKFLRIVRLFRLLKLVRILRASRIVARWQTMIEVPFTVQSLAKCSASTIIALGCRIALACAIIGTLCALWYPPSSWLLMCLVLF
eukprot:gnl/MRDRNA2_/MRDRNA2_69592_c0_seq1.p1 gnl/MRDRNA2_/MRDRNA2_69592_c0~~gnl/MRDRNA2_/MRDRNA2_69592_c0_seq1.p1  ORF type:complete len:303 (+),score=37.48 gnl/MRDRNA2_/MRDRNA2_69592_c0_seq1:81-989(+)